MIVSGRVKQHPGCSLVERSLESSDDVSLTSGVAAGRTRQWERKKFRCQMAHVRRM